MIDRGEYIIPKICEMNIPHHKNDVSWPITLEMLLSSSSLNDHAIWSRTPLDLPLFSISSLMVSGEV
jgi:hypothetical protein